MIFRLLPLFVLLSVSARNSVCAQHLRMKQLTTRDGLGHSVVYRTSQDRDGFVWFSTDNGLTRYDGKTFTNFTASHGLESSFVFGTLQNDTSFLVASYGQGIAAYDRRNAKFRILPHTRSLRYTIQLTAAHRGILVVDRSKKLFKLHRDNVMPVSGKTEDGDPLNIVFKVIETSSGRLLAATGSGLAWYDYDTDDFSIVKMTGLPPATNSCAVIEIARDVVVMASNEALYHVDFRKRNATLLMRGNFYNHSECLFKDKQGNLWVSSLNGELWLFSADLSTRECVMKGIIVNNVFQDRENTVWLATYGDGVFCIPTLAVRQHTFGNAMLVSDLYWDKAVRQPIALSSNFGVSTVTNHENAIRKLYRVSPLLKKKHLVTVINPAEGEYIAGTHSYIYRQSNKRVDSISCKSSVSVLYKNSRNRYWIGTRSGLLYTDSLFTRTVPVPMLDKRIIRSISKDFTDRALIGTDQGLYRETRSGWDIHGITSGLPNAYVNTIYRDTIRRCHWIGTNEGLARLSTDGKITVFEHPLAKLRCNSITGDDAGNIWIATNQGLIRYAQDTFLLFNDDDGLPSDIFNVIYERTTGTVYALSWNGLSLVQVDSLTEPAYARSRPALVINEVLIDDQPVELRRYHILEHTASRITLKSSVPYVHNRKQWHARYRVNTREWVPVSDESQITVYDIPFKDVSIQIQVVDDNGYSVVEKTFSLYNPVPLHRQIWFGAMLLLAFVTAIVLLTWYSIRHRAHRRELILLENQQRMELEHKALRNMLNPHFLNNAVNSIQAFVTRNDQRNTLGYLAKFARLMRANLELLENNIVTLQKELQNLELYLTFEMLRFGGNLSYSLSVDPAVDTETFKIPSLVLQPFAENAIWHGLLPRDDRGHLQIHITKDQSRLVITLEDDGIGIQESLKRKEINPAEKPSRGLNIVKKRFALLNNTTPGYSVVVQDRSTRTEGATGTLVQITIPILY